MAWFHFLWLSDIPVCVYRIFFIHSSVDGHTGCFLVLVIPFFFFNMERFMNLRVILAQGPC